MEAETVSMVQLLLQHLLSDLQEIKAVMISR